MKDKNSIIEWTRTEIYTPFAFDKLSRYQTVDEASTISFFDISQNIVAGTGYITVAFEKERQHTPDPKKFIALLQASDEILRSIKKDLGAYATIYFDIQPSSTSHYRPVPR